MPLEVMLDLETMSTSSSAAIVSIGAVKFDPHGKIGDFGDPANAEYKPFYCTVELTSCIDAGLHVSGSTIEWWLKQENDAAVVDRFRRISSSSASGGSYDRTSHVKATGRSGPALTFQFKGTGISWYGTKGPSYGKAYIYIDSVYKGSVDLYYSSTRYKQRIWTSATLTNSAHTLKILVYGTRRSGAKGYDVSFDYFTIK